MMRLMYPPLPEAQPPLWAEFQVLLPELKQLESMLTEGNFTEVENPNDPYYQMPVGQGTWHAGYWEYQGDVYVVVVNTHKTAAQVIDIALPNVTDGDADPMFAMNERYGSGMLVENGRLTGTISSGDVHVYRLPQLNTVRADGVLIVNGKPFFPLGIYQGGLDTGRYENDVLVGDINTIAAAGFNFIHTSMDHTFDKWDNWGGEEPAKNACERAAELGIFLGDSLYLGDPSFLETEVSVFHAKHEALIVTSIGDDFIPMTMGASPVIWKRFMSPPTRCEPCMDV